MDDYPIVLCSKLEIGLRKGRDEQKRERESGENVWKATSMLSEKDKTGNAPAEMPNAGPK